MTDPRTIKTEVILGPQKRHRNKEIF